MKGRGQTLALGSFLLVLGLLLTSCVSFAETPGEYFDRAMKRLAENCAKAKLKPNDTACDPLKLGPADPFATSEGRFAHSVNIPNSVPQGSGYKPGMTPEEYFEHLCRTEAGEFIFKTVENVEGLYIMRPRESATDYELQHLTALEDPYGYLTEGATADARFNFINPSRFQFIETRAFDTTGNAKTGYRRYFGYNARDLKTMKVEQVNGLKSKYGYTWRGISRPHDRELGVAGGELIVLDLQTNEVLAVRRGYIRSGDVRNNFTGVWWLGGHACPKGSGRPELYTFEFITKVLKPIIAK